jgi:NACHT domain
MAFTSIAGSGKSVLWYVDPSTLSSRKLTVSVSSTIIEEIETTRKSGLASLAIFFFDFRENQKKGVRALVSSVLVQLCRQSDAYCDILSKLYWEHGDGHERPSDARLVRCLRTLLEVPRQAPIFLIVDALDECPNTPALSSPREKVLILLKSLVDLRLPNLRICVTSRPELDIKDILEASAFRSVSLHDESGQKEDMKNYIESVMNTNKNMRNWSLEHRQLVIDVLAKRADGM